MSETAEVSGRDSKTGQFVKGFSGGPGRKVGSRNKLGEAFVADLAACWEKHGIEALERCATEEPAQFVRVIANLLPRDIDINLTASIDASSFADRFRNALALLGNPAPETRMKAIEHDDVGHRR